MSSRPKPPVAVSKYDRLVEDAKELISGVRSDLLIAYWNFGDMCTKVDKPAYGSRTVEQFAEDIGIDKSRTWICLQFKTAYPLKADLERIQKLGLSWSNVRPLVTDKIDVATRKELEQKVATEQLSVREFAAIVKEKTGGSKSRPAVTVPDSPLGVFVKTSKIARRLISILESYEKACKDSKKLKGDVRQDTDAAHLETMEEIKTLVKTMRSIKNT